MTRVLITAGGMRRPIDDVRSIVNSSSGRLAQACAHTLLDREELSELIYVHGPDAQLPRADERVRCVPVDGTQDLLDMLERELTGDRHVDYLIHAMAVADYEPDGVFTREQIAAGEYTAHGDRKISSAQPELYVRLTRTPKVIDTIKRLSPRTFLVGFKLLSGATDTELSDVAFAMLRRTRANLVLANDLQQIRSGQPHRGLLIHPEKHTDIIEGGKQAIAARLVDVMLRRGSTRFPRSDQESSGPSPAAHELLPVLRACGAGLDNGALPVVDGGTYGNLSVRVPDAVQQFVITGRGVDKRALTADRLAHVVASTELYGAGTYRTVPYLGPVKPSIDSAIHASVYAHTDVDAMVHVHDPAIYEDVPLTATNAPCGSEAERDGIISCVPGGSPAFLVGLHKHGLLAGAADLGACVQALDDVRERMHLTPLAGARCETLMAEWEAHVDDVTFSEDPIDPDAALRADERLMWTVVDAGGRVGLAWYCPRWDGTDWTGEFFLYLGAHAARGRGLGGRVVALLRELGRRDGCCRLRLITRPGCGVAGYYEHKLGFTPVPAEHGLLRLESAL